MFAKFISTNRRCGFLQASSYLTKKGDRIYVLVESVMPLRAHLCRSAMLRKCMEEYKPLHAGEKMQKFSLLTNTSINKKWKPEYMANSAGNGCKMPLHAAFDELEAQVYSIPVCFNLLCA